MAADSPSSSTSAEDLAVVSTADELLQAVNDDGIRHIVIRSHMNITSPNSSSSTHLRAALLQLPISTKHIQGDCVEDHPTSQPRLPRQCVLNVRQSFLEASQESAVRLANLYITSSPPFAPATQPAPSPALSPSPEAFSIQVQKTAQEDDEARYISYLEIYKADLWMYNVTLEGASEGSIEGVNVLGASSTTGRAYSEGCLFTGFRSATGAAWSIHASRARTDDLPTAAAFTNCSFTDNTALRSGGAIFVERAGALRLDGCTFSGNAAPDGADVAAEDTDPDVFARPPITVRSIGVSRTTDGVDVPSRTVAAAVALDFPKKNDDFDAEIAAEFAEIYQQQPLPAPAPLVVDVVPAPAEAPLVAPIEAAPASAEGPAQQPIAAAPAATVATLPPSSASTGPAEAATPAQTALLAPAEAAGEGSSASGLLRQAPGQELADNPGQQGSNSLPESTLVATLAAAAVLAVFLVALLLFVSRHKARRRRKTEAVAEPASGRAAGRGAGMRSGMDIVSSGPPCITEDFHVLYVLPRIQEEGTGDLAATSSLMGGHTESETA